MVLTRASMEKIPLERTSPVKRRRLALLADHPSLMLREKTSVWSALRQSIDGGRRYQWILFLLADVP